MTQPEPTDLSLALRALIWPHPSATGYDPLSETAEDALFTELESGVPTDNPETWGAVWPGDERPAFQSVHVVVEGHPAGWVFGAAGDPSGDGGWPAPHAVLAADWAAAGGPPQEFTFECCDCGVVGCGGFWSTWEPVSLTAAERAALDHPLDLAAPGVAAARLASGLGEADAGAYLRLRLRARESNLTVWTPLWAVDPVSWPLRRALQSRLRGAQPDPALDALVTALHAAGLAGVHDQPRPLPSPRGGIGQAARRAVPSARLESLVGPHLDWQLRRWGHRAEVPGGADEEGVDEAGESGA